MILVTGATGNVGREVVRELCRRGTEVRAIVRDPHPLSSSQNIDVVRGDLDDAEVIMPALEDVRSVFLLGSFTALPELVTRIHKTGVEHIALLTSRCVIGGAPDNAITRMWIDAEDAVRASGVAWTIMRPSGFHSNSFRWLPQLAHGDVVRTPWPDVAIASIDPADIAAVAAVSLTEDGFTDCALTLSGPDPLTPAQQVATLARALGRPLAYEPLDDEEARISMSADTPPEFIDAFFRFFSNGEFDDSRVVDTVHRITGRQPRTFEQWVADHLTGFRP